MTELVLDWLHTEAGISIDSAHMEERFANGYRFGELLRKYKQFPSGEDFQDHHTVEAKLANFQKLQPVLKSLGVKTTSERIQEVMAGKRGAALRLLYQVKMALENAQPPSDHGNTEKGDMFQVLRLPRTEYDAHDERFFEGRLRAVAYRESDRNLARKLKPFEDEAVRQEQLARELDRIDEERHLVQRDRNRQIMLEKQAQTKAFLDDWQRRGMATWQDNLDRKWQREQAELSFEKNRIIKRHGKTCKIREDATREMAEIDRFEQNLETLGLEHGPLNWATDQDHNDAVRTMLTQASKVETGDELAAEFQTKFPTPDEMREDAETYLRKHQESKFAGTLARQERERRRRKYLVESHRLQSIVEDKHLEDAIMQKLLRESLEEKRIAYGTWRTDRLEDVVRLNRELRDKDYKRRAKEDHRLAVQRDQEIARQELALTEDELTKESRRFRDLERGRLARANECIADDCELIVGLLVDLAETVRDARQLSDTTRSEKQLCDPMHWQECLKAFVEGSSSHPLKMPVAQPYALPESRSGDPPPKKKHHMLDKLQQLPAATATERFLEAERPGEGEAVRQALQGQLQDYLSFQEVWRAPDGEMPPGLPELEKDGAPTELATSMPFLKEIVEPDKVGTEPYDPRLGTVVARALERKFQPPPPPPPPTMPRVPIRLILTGKPLSGKQTVYRRLQENYNLQVIVIDELVKECLALAGRHENDPLTVTVTPEPDEDFGPPLDEFASQLRELGHQMAAVLDRGEEIPDESYVDAVVNKIRSIFVPENVPPAQDGEPCNGWVLVGFPKTQWQYAQLERALSGFCAPALQHKTELERRLENAQLLAPCPADRKDAPARFVGGCDYHVVLDVPNDEVLRRACGKRRDPKDELEYHLEDSPPYPLDYDGAEAFSSSKKGNQTVIFERLEFVDELEASFGTLTDRLHVFDERQLEIAEFAQLLGKDPSTPRLVTVPLGTPDRVYDVIDELVADMLEKWEYNEQFVSVQEPSQEAAAEADAGYGIDAPEAPAGGADGAAAEPAEPVPAPPAEPPEPPRLLSLSELSQHVYSLEERSLELLVQQWLDLEQFTKRQLLEVFDKHRSNRRAVLSGEADLQQRYLHALTEPCEDQRLVDGFLHEINAFTDEYPDMRRDDATKAELHARTHDLQVELQGKIEAREEQSAELQRTLQATGWQEGHELALGVLVQRLVQVELAKLSAARQLLVDFYTLASGELLLAPEAPPRFDMFELSAHEPKADEAADPKAKAKPKKGEEVPVEDPKLPPLRAVVPDQVEGEGENATVTAPSHVAYPLLDALFVQADTHASHICRFLPWTPGQGLAEEEENKEEEDPKAAAKAKAAAKPKKGEEPPKEEAPPPKPCPHAWVDLNQALFSLSRGCVYRLRALRAWSERQLDELALDAASLWRRLEETRALHFRSEELAVQALVDQVCEHIEAEEKFPCVLSLADGKVRTHANLLLDPPAVPQVRVPLESEIAGRPSMPQLERLLAAAHALARGGCLRGSQVLELGRQLSLGDLALGERATALDAVLGFALPGLWPTSDQLVQACQQCLEAAERGEGLPDTMDEATFLRFAPFDRELLADPSGFPRADHFLRWVFRAFETFRGPLPPGRVDVRQVMGTLALGETAHEGMRTLCRVLYQDPDADLPVETLHQLLVQDGVRPAFAELEPTDAVVALRSCITPPPLTQAIRSLPPEERPPVTDQDLVQGKIVGGLGAVLQHPGLRALQPFVERFQRPAHSPKEP